MISVISNFPKTRESHLVFVPIRVIRGLSVSTHSQPVLQMALTLPKPPTVYDTHDAITYWLRDRPGLVPFPHPNESCVRSVKRYCPDERPWWRSDRPPRPSGVSAGS